MDEPEFNRNAVVDLNGKWEQKKLTESQLDSYLMLIWTGVNEVSEEWAKYLLFTSS